MLCPRIVKRIGPRQSLFIALAVFALHYIVIAATSNAWIVGAALFVEMFAAVLWNVVTVSYRQRLIPDDLLGRVNSIYRFFGWGMMPIGALLGGWVVTFAEPSLGRFDALRAVFYLAAAGSALMFLYGATRLRLSQDAT